MCHVKGKESIPSRIGQNILVNNGVLSVVKNIIIQEVDKSLEVWKMFIILKFNTFIFFC